MIIEINEYLKTVSNKKILIFSNLNKFIHTDNNGNIVGFVDVDQRSKSHDSFYLGQNMANHGLIDLVIIDNRKENTLDKKSTLRRYNKDFQIKLNYDTAYIVDHDNGFYIEVEE